MDLSVIIVSWNARSFLLECLRSVKQETAPYNTEIIVVDNASTDGSCDAVRTKFPDVELIRNSENLGFAKANNIGIGKSSGKYVCLVNSDVTVMKDCIVRMAYYLDAHPEIGMLGPKIRNSDGSLQSSCRGFPTLWNNLCRALALDTFFPRLKLFGGKMMKYWMHDEIRSVDVLSGCFWMVRREALDEVGLLDERFFIYAEDIDWCRRFHKTGWDVVLFPYAEAVHFGGASSSNAPTRFYVEMQRANWLYWKKYHNTFVRSGFVAIAWIHLLTRAIGQGILYAVIPSRRAESALKLRGNAAAMGWLVRSGKG